MSDDSRSDDKEFKAWVQTKLMADRDVIKFHSSGRRSPQWNEFFHKKSGEYRFRLAVDRPNPTLADLVVVSDSEADHSSTVDFKLLHTPLTQEQVEQWSAVSKAAFENSMQEVHFAPELPSPPIEIAPGFGTLNFLGHFCQKNFRERVLEPLHAEATEDFYESLKRGDMTRAKYVKRMMHVWMLWAMVGGVISWVGGKLSLRVGGTSE